MPPPAVLAPLPRGGDSFGRAWPGWQKGIEESPAGHGNAFARRKHRRRLANHRDGELAARFRRLPRIGRPSGRRIVDVAAIRFARHEVVTRLDARGWRWSDLKEARATIVVQRLEERCIDREARAAGVEHQPEYAVAIVELVPPSKHAMGKSRSGLPQRTLSGDRLSDDPRALSML